MAVNKKLLTLVLSFLISANACSHAGGLDVNGGHEDRKRSVYHCHRDDCNPIAIIDEPIVLNDQSGYKKTGYNRKNWRHWIDKNNDCQDTRAEILIASSSVDVTFQNSQLCTVYSGKWYDPYSDKFWALASDVDIDHIVPLAWAYLHGASGWSSEKKAKFANDANNLIAVEDNLNQEKGAKGPDQWLPPNQFFRCVYVKNFDNIVKRYSLNYESSESVYINYYIKTCSHKL